MPSTKRKLISVYKEISDWAKVPADVEEIMHKYKHEKGLEPSLSEAKDIGYTPKADLIRCRPADPGFTHGISDASYSKDKNTAGFGSLLKEAPGICVGYSCGGSKPYSNPLLHEVIGASATVELAVLAGSPKLHLVTDSKDCACLVAAELGLTLPPDNLARVQRIRAAMNPEKEAVVVPEAPSAEGFIVWKGKKARNKEGVEKRDADAKKNEKDQVWKLIRAFLKMMRLKVRRHWTLDKIFVSQEPRERLYSADCLSRVEVDPSIRIIWLPNNPDYPGSSAANCVFYFIRRDATGYYIKFHTGPDAYEFVKEKLAKLRNY